MMKYNKCRRAAWAVAALIFARILLCGGPSSFAGDTPEPKLFRFALSQRAIGMVNHNEYISAIKSWVQLVGSTNNFEVTGEVEVFDSFDREKTASCLKKADAFVLTPIDMEQLALTPEHAYLTVQGTRHEVNYAVIVHRKGSIKAVEDLKKAKIQIHDTGWTILARPWLKSLLADASPLAAGRWVSIGNPSKGLLEVFFGQAPAVLVRRQSFDLACELNPQLKSELLVLAQSPPLIPILMVFKTSEKGSVTRKMAAAARILHMSERGKQILAFYRSSHIEKHRFSIMEPTIAHLKAYREAARGSGPDAGEANRLHGRRIAESRPAKAGN